jgi:hypothetical protein
MEYVIASYLRQVWDKNDWLYKGQHGFRPGYSCESQVITDCQNIADSIDNGDKIDAIVIDFSKIFYLVPHDQVLMKIANSGVGSWVVAWVREFLLGHTQRVRVNCELGREFKGGLMGKGVPFGSHAECQIRKAIIKGSYNTLCTAKERNRSSSVSNLR